MLRLAGWRGHGSTPRSMTLFMVALGAAFACGGWLVDTYGVGAPMFCAACTAGLGALMCLRVPEIFAQPAAAI